MSKLGQIIWQFFHPCNIFYIYNTVKIDKLDQNTFKKINLSEILWFDVLHFNKKKVRE